MGDDGRGRRRRPQRGADRDDRGAARPARAASRSRRSWPTAPRCRSPDATLRPRAARRAVHRARRAAAPARGALAAPARDDRRARGAPARAAGRRGARGAAGRSARLLGVHAERGRDRRRSTSGPRDASPGLRRRATRRARRGRASGGARACSRARPAPTACTCLILAGARSSLRIGCSRWERSRRRSSPPTSRSSPPKSSAVAADADLLHVDVMDGHFVPNLSIGAPVVKCLRPRTDLFLDCHLMIDNPGDLLDDFAEAGADSCTVHVELGDPRPLFDRMRAPRHARRARAEPRDAARRGAAVPRRDRPPAVHERAPRLRRAGVHPRGARQGARRARDRRRARPGGRARDRRRDQPRDRAARPRPRAPTSSWPGSAVFGAADPRRGRAARSAPRPGADRGGRP